MTKTQNKGEILDNQKLVANSLSNIDHRKLEKSSEFLDSPFEKNQTAIDESNLRITRGWFDFKAINIRFTQKEIFNKFFPIKIE